MLKKFPVIKNNKEYKVIIIDTTYGWEFTIYKKSNFKLFWLININIYKELYVKYFGMQENTDFIQMANIIIDEYENTIQKEIDYQNSIKEAKNKFNKWDGVYK